MVSMNEGYMALGVFVLGFGLYWYLRKKVAKAEKELRFAAEMHDVLNNPTYKTKGKFE